MFAKYSNVCPDWLAWRDIVIARSQPRKIFVQPNTVVKGWRISDETLFLCYFCLRRNIRLKPRNFKYTQFRAHEIECLRICGRIFHLNILVPNAVYNLLGNFLIWLCNTYIN